MQRWFRLPWQGLTAAGWKAGSSWNRLTGIVLAVAAVFAIGGCETGSFIPPQPEELRGADEESLGVNSSIPRLDGSQTAPAANMTVVLILDRHDPDQTDLLKALARIQAGVEKVKLTIESLGEQDLPARQADLVRDALARNPLALIVEPADPADVRLADALKDAQTKGLPIVLLNRPLEGGRAMLTSISDQRAETDKRSTQPVPGPGALSTPPRRPARPIVLVTSVSFVASANQLVESAIRNAKNAKLDPAGGVVILLNSSGDSLIENRAAALRTALRSNNVTDVAEVRFSKQLELGARLLIERLKANPKLVMVFSVDSLTCGASRHAMNQIVSERPFVLAGYAEDESYAQATQTGEFAAVAEFAPGRVLRRALTTAVALAQGRDLPSRIEIPINVSDSPASSAVPKSAYKRSGAEATKKGH